MGWFVHCVGGFVVVEVFRFCFSKGNKMGLVGGREQMDGLVGFLVFL